MNQTIVDGAAPGHAVDGAQESATAGNDPGTTEKQQTQGNFWSHLFSFDSGAGAKSVNPYERVIGAARLSQPAIWLTALKNAKLSSVFEGLSVTPNFKFFVLIAGFTGWLFVVDYVRKHEHDSYKIGNRATADFSTASADRSIVSAVRGAYPYDVVPAPAVAPQPPPEHISYMASGPGQAMSANYIDDQRFGVPNQDSSSTNAGYFSAPEPIVPSPVPLQSSPVYLPSSVAQPQAIPRTSDLSTAPAYNMQINSIHGSWLRTIVVR